MCPAPGWRYLPLQQPSVVLWDHQERPSLPCWSWRGDVVAEDIARVWPAGAGRLGALLQLPALAARAGDIGVVLIEIELP